MNKKLMFVVASTVLVAGVASADLSISWLNTQVQVSATGTGDLLADGSIVQLIYSQTGNVTAPGAYAVEGGAMLAGETLLLQSTTAAGFGIWNQINTGVVVGDFTGGVFFTRIFSDAAASGSFYDTVAIAGSAWEYQAGPPADPATVYTAQALLGEAGVGAGTEMGLNNDGRATTVVPEPATFGLMGVAALGLFLARKKARR